ncbi:MAG: B12-binding domain-containing radical SAM protein [Phycisphaerae bacterium]
MKVLMVYPDIRGPLRVSRKGYFYNGLACIAAVLKRSGHDVRLLHYLSAPPRDRFEADLLHDPPDLVAYSATTNLFPFVQTWSRWCRERIPDALQICGGVHPTLYWRESLLTSELDAVCVGEGEWPMIELCDHLERGGCAYPAVANLTFLERGGVMHHHAPRPRMNSTELDSMPFADRSLFSPDKLCEPDRPILIASRGCPYDCAYCCNRALLRVLGNSSPVRIRSVDNVIGEIKYIRESLPHVTAIHFDDDIFGLRPSWMREFARRYSAEVNLPFSCNVRPNLASHEMVQLLAGAGCAEVAMGVETGDCRLRRTLLRRDIDNQLLAEAFRRFERAGIRTHSFNMVGVPHETMENSLETIKLNAALKKRWRMHELRVSILYPYAGTPIFDEARAHGMLTSRNVTYYADDTVLDLDTMTGTQVRFVARYFRLLVLAYSRFLHDLGIPGRTFSKLLDRILLSQFAGRYLFPIANALYPWALRGVRWWKSYEKRVPRGRVELATQS